MPSIKTFTKIVIILAGIIFLFYLLSQGKVYPVSDLSYGMTFSEPYAKFLGLDWKQVFTDSLDDLKIRKFRLPAYWDEIQAADKDHYDYSDLDWQINEVGKRNGTVILAVGYRLPRWPECHLPEWAANLSQEDKQQGTLDYLKRTVERYKNDPQIIAWQVENEPFLTFFGDCPKFNPAFLDKEIAMVKSLDSRPIVVTDSGELSYWYSAASRADIFGTSVYLNTYSGNIKNYIHYPILPGYFQFKKNIIGLFAHPKDWIVIEMQAEPWGPVAVTDLTEAQIAQTMSPEKLKYILDFGRLAGFKDFYLWGVEWWAYEKQFKNNSVYWEYAKTLFK